MPKLRRIAIHLLEDKYGTEAADLNARKRTISSLEADICQLDYLYVSTHGLDIATLWPDVADMYTTPEAQTRRAQLRRENTLRPDKYYAAEMLRNVRLEAGRTGHLRSGKAGTFEDIIRELEYILSDLIRTARRGY